MFNPINATTGKIKKFAEKIKGENKMEKQTTKSSGSANMRSKESKSASPRAELKIVFTDGTYSCVVFSSANWEAEIEGMFRRSDYVRYLIVEVDSKETADKIREIAAKVADVPKTQAQKAPVDPPVQKQIQKTATKKPDDPKPPRKMSFTTMSVQQYTNGGGTITPTDEESWKKVVSNAVKDKNFYAIRYDEGPSDLNGKVKEFFEQQKLAVSEDSKGRPIGVKAEALPQPKPKDPAKDPKPPTQSPVQQADPFGGPTVNADITNVNNNVIRIGNHLYKSNGEIVARVERQNRLTEQGFKNVLQVIDDGVNDINDNNDANTDRVVEAVDKNTTAIREQGSISRTRLGVSIVIGIVIALTLYFFDFMKEVEISDIITMVGTNPFAGNPILSPVVGFLVAAVYAVFPLIGGERK